MGHYDDARERHEERRLERLASDLGVSVDTVAKLEDRVRLYRLGARLAQKKAEEEAALAIYNEFKGKEYKNLTSFLREGET